MSHMHQTRAGLISFALCMTAIISADLPALAQEAPKRKRPVAVQKAPPADEQPGAADEPVQPRRRLKAQIEAPGEASANPADGPQGQTRQARPAPAPLRIEPLDPELEQFLQQWEVASAKIQRLSGPFKKFEYDKTFQVEKQAEGKFTYEAPDKGHYEISGELPANAKAGMKFGNPPRPFQLAPCKAEHWICNGKEIYLINHAEKTFTVDIVPPDQRGKNIINGPLPFLFGMKAEQAKKRYFLTMLPQTNAQLMWLQVKPRLQQDAVNWTEATVIIDRTLFLPKAVRMEAPSGTQTIVHHFDIAEMQKTMNRNRGILQSDPLVPKTGGYKLVQPEGTVQQTKGEAPAPGRVSTKQRAVPRAAEQRSNEAPSQAVPQTNSRAASTKPRALPRQPAQ